MFPGARGGALQNLLGFMRILWGTFAGFTDIYSEIP